MKKLILILICFISLSANAQLDVKPNYTSPLFQGNVGVADTLGVDTLFTENNRMLIVDSLAYKSDIPSSGGFVDFKNGIYTGNGIIPSNTTATLTDKLTFSNGSNDVLKINSNQTASIGEYLGTKNERTTLLINGNAGNSAANAIGLHVKSNIDAGTYSDVCLIENGNPFGSTPTSTSSIFRVKGGYNTIGTVNGLNVSSYATTGIGVVGDKETQLKVEHVQGNSATPLYGTVCGEFTNSVTRALVNWGAVKRYKHGMKITSTGVWTSLAGAPYEAVNIGLDVNVDGGNLNYSALFNGGAVGIGTATPDNSAILEINSTTSGFLPPRMTTAQRDAIVSPAAGLQVYNSTTNTPQFYNGTIWANI